MTSVISPEQNIVNNLPRKSSLKPSSSKINLDSSQKDKTGGYENEGFESNISNNNENEESDTLSFEKKPCKGSNPSPSTGRRKSVVTFNDNTEVFQFSSSKK